MTETTHTNPDISVVICTRNRADELIHALRSVLANTYASFDVTLIDQSDDDSSRAIVELCRAEFGDRVPLHYVPTGTRGLGTARNLALQAVHGNVIAFTDDDCLVPADWVQTISHLFTNDPELGMVYGQVHMPDEYKQRDDIVVPCLYFESYRVLQAGDIFGMGANVALHRRVINTIGGFDTTLGAGGPFGGGEDFDFTYRAQKAGLKVVADPTLTVIHKSFRTKDRWAQVLYAYGRGDAAFYNKHARCGDSWARSAITSRMTYRTLRGIARTLLGRGKAGDWAYLRGFREGLRDSRDYPVDVPKRMYATATTRLQGAR